MFEPGTLGQAGTEHIKAKLIENTNFPRIVDVEKRPHLSETGVPYKLDIYKALETHEIVFIIDDTAFSICTNFLMHVESTMLQMIESKFYEKKHNPTDVHSQFYTNFSNVIILVYEINDFLDLEHPRRERAKARRESRKEITMATEHLTNVAKFSVYWLQRSPDLVTAFKSWTDKCQPYHDHRYVTLAKLYKYIHPHRKNTKHRIKIEVLCSLMPDDTSKKIRLKPFEMYLVGHNFHRKISGHNTHIALMQYQFAYKFQLETLSRIVQNIFLQDRAAPTLVLTSSIQSANKVTINDIPDTTWIYLLDEYFFKYDIYSIRMLGTTCKFFYNLISNDLPRALCKIPSLKHTDDEDEILEDTVKGIAALIEPEPSYEHNSISVQNVKLITAISMLDRIIALSGAYYKELVLTSLKAKNEIKELYVSAKTTEDFDCVKGMYMTKYTELYDNFGTLINNSIDRAGLLTYGSTEYLADSAETGTELEHLGHRSVPPLCAGTIELHNVIAQLLSNAGQCCLKQYKDLSKSKIWEDEYEETFRILSLATVYAPNHTKSLWRLGLLEMKYENFKKAKEFFIKAKRSTRLPKELKAIKRSLIELKKKRSQAIDKTARQYEAMTNTFKRKMDINNEHNLMDRDAIFTYSDKQRAEFDEAADIKNTTKSDDKSISPQNKNIKIPPPFKKKKQLSKEDREAHLSFMEDLGKTAQAKGYMPDMEVIDAIKREKKYQEKDD